MLRLFLIDGSSQMYRAYHAPVRTAEGGFLRNAQGRPTNAVYIFVTMLRKLMNEHQPEYIAASFDLPGRTFRDDLGQVVDVLALMGDTIDNIKGVPGIGEKGARELIAQYGTLDSLLAHAAEIKNKRQREGLLNHAADARQSQVLARIHTDVPVEFDAEALRY